MAWRRATADHVLAAAVVASALSAVVLAVRLALAWDAELTWMTWNLLLAWVPLATGLAIARAVARGAGRWTLVGLSAVWLAFLPNAPYLVTDLVHLRGRQDGLPVLDLAVFGAFAVTGLLLFVAAVHPVQRAARIRLGGRRVPGFVAACIWLSAIGIYLGRVLRWNSWDLALDPVGRTAGLVAHLDDPRNLAAALAFTLAVGIGLHAAYAVIGRPDDPGRR
jgi:uncharacterized membrane protein